MTSAIDWKRREAPMNPAGGSSGGGNGHRPHVVGGTTDQPSGQEPSTPGASPGASAPPRPEPSQPPPADETDPTGGYESDGGAAKRPVWPD